jgi:hypothetical protein
MDLFTPAFLTGVSDMKKQNAIANLSTFLSLDMDFFNYNTRTDKVINFLDSILDLGVPITAVMNHQQMLPIVNASKARLLLNIDAHSDLTEDPYLLDCGSWVSYVSWASRGTYHWWDCSHSEGDCSGFNPIFMYRTIRHNTTYWNNLQHTNSNTAPNLSRFKITEVAICMSPEYSDQDLQILFKQWVKKNNIPYIKGRRDETYCRQCLPPGGSFVKDFATTYQKSKIIHSRWIAKYPCLQGCLTGRKLRLFTNRLYKAMKVEYKGNIRTDRIRINCRDETVPGAFCSYVDVQSNRLHFKDLMVPKTLVIYELARFLSPFRLASIFRLAAKTMAKSKKGT